MSKTHSKEQLERLMYKLFPEITKYANEINLTDTKEGVFIGFSKKVPTDLSEKVRKWLAEAQHK